MKNDLQILIDELQKEYKFLQDEMNFCIEESDFIRANAFMRAMNYTSEKLRILQNLDNPNYDKIQWREQLIERLSKGTGSFYTKRIQAYQQELNELQNINKVYYDSDKLIICYEKLMVAEINYLEIIVENNMSVNVSKSERGLKIIIKSITPDSRENFITHKQAAILKQLGFELEDNNAIMVDEQYEGKGTLEIIQLLSRIFLEVFQFYGNQQAVIKYG